MKKIVVSFLLFLLFLTISFFVWIGIEPREVNWLAAYIERGVSDENISLKIEKTLIAFSGFDELLNIKVEGITARYKGAHIKLPEASVKISLLKLLNKKIAISQITVKNPKVSLYVKDGNISLHPDDDTTLQEIMEGTLEIVEQVVIKNADFSLNNNNVPVLKSSLANIELKKVGNFIAGNVLINLDDNSFIDAKVALHTKTKQFTAYGQINNLKLNVLDAFSDYNTDVPLTGGFNARLNFEEQTQSTAFKLRGQSGSVTLPEYFIEPLEVKKIQLSGTISNRVININDAYVELPEGKVSADLYYEDGSYALNMNVSDYNLRDLYKHWPTVLGSETRKWVTEHLEIGDVSKASLNLSNLDGKEKLDAKIHFEDATLDYYSPLPPVKNTKGVAKFNNESMRITVQHGEILSSTKTKNTTVIIEDFEHPTVDLVVKFEALLTDVWNYLSYEPFEYTQKFNINAKRGTAKGTLNLSIPVNGTEDITFNALADFKDADLDFGELKISNASGNFSINNEKLEINSDGKLNNAVADLKLHSVLGENEVHAANLDVIITPNELPEAWRKHIDGVIRMNAVLGAGKVAINADISDAYIDLHGLNKEKGVAGNITFNLISNGDEKRMENVEIMWDNTYVLGNMLLKKNSITSLNIKEATFGKNDFGLDFDGDNLNIYGNTLDILPIINENKLLLHAPNNVVFHIKAKLNKVFIYGKEGVKDVIADLFCKNSKCQFVDIKGSTSKPFSIFKSGGEIVVESQDAGGFIKELGISPYVVEGSMKIKAKEIDGAITGNLKIKDFSVRNAPTLTKILRLASITGIINTIRGKELYFNRAYIIFSYKNKKFTVKRGSIAEGASVGFTGEGIIHIGGDLLIKGTIIPSYTLNTILGKIPLVGQVLSGGNEGVFVTNYEVKKTNNVIDVYVNPLSTLAPNSLKRLFR